MFSMSRSRGLLASLLIAASVLTAAEDYALGPDSERHADVPKGAVTKYSWTSKIYPGTVRDYWVYVPAQYKPDKAACVMIFQDGGGYTRRDGNNPALNAIDNLIAQKQIPVMICVFINPGDIADSPGAPTYTFVKAYSDKWHRTLKDSMRSTLYDTVSDRYPRFLRDDQAQKSFSKLRSSIGGIYSWRLGLAPSGTGVPPQYIAKTEAERIRMMREADFAYKQAFACCPYSPEAVTRFVNLLYGERRFEDALLIAETCLKLDPYNGFMQGLVLNIKQILQRK